MNLTKFLSTLGVLLLLVFTHQATASEYTYDPLNRLIQVVYDNGDSLTYHYDAAGNLTETASSVNATNAIVVVSPDNGETWQVGTTQAILWNTTGTVGDEVSIELYRGGVLDSVLTAGTFNDGSYSWAIPAGLTPASDYQIKITSTSNPTFSDFSNTDFSITTGDHVLSTISIIGPSQVRENSSTGYEVTASYSDGSTSPVTESVTWSDDSPYAILVDAQLSTSYVDTNRQVNVTANYIENGITKTVTKAVTILNSIPGIPGSGTNVAQTTQGSYVRLALTGLVPGSIVTITSDDGAYTYTFTVPGSGRLFPEVRAGATGTLHITITDADGNPIDQQTIALDVVPSTDRVTNQRTTPGNLATTTSFTRPTGYSGAVIVRYTAQPSESSAIGILTDLPASGDSLAGGTVSYTGTATSTTDSGLALGRVYYYRVYPYYAVYVSDGQGGQTLDHYQFGPGVTSSARTDLTGSLAADLTLNNDNVHPYRLTGSFTVEHNVTLIINEGVTIYGNDRSSRLIVNGNLTAEATGESDRIVFTTNNATPAAGNWGYIRFAQGSTGSLKYVTIEYAGDDNIANSSDGLYCAGLYIDSSPTIDHLLLQHISDVSAGTYTGYYVTVSAGIWIRYDAEPVIQNSVIQDVEYYGIYATQTDATKAIGSFQILNNRINVAEGAVYLYYHADGNNPVIYGNDMSGSGYNGSLLVRGTITGTGHVWQQDITLVGQVNIAAGSSLTINPNVTIYGNDRSSRLIVNGNLTAEATGESDRIVFTTNNATPAAGDWGYIRFAQGSTGSLKFVTIEYAGDDNIANSRDGLYCAGLYIDSSPTIDHLLLQHISDVSAGTYTGYYVTVSAGIWIRYDAEPVIQNSVIQDVESWGIYHVSTSSITLTGNAIYDNSGGVYSSGSSGAQVDATNVYWGDPSGPYHNPLNLDGLGNKVSDHVLFSPWDSVDPSDTDQDGIPDAWEQLYFPGTAGLVILSATGDYDHDGYSDYQEYLNGTNPTVQDPPGGPGYDESLITFQLTISFAGNGTGTINLTPPDGNCTADCAQNYLYGNQVTLTAVPDEGQFFKGWAGAGCSGTGPCTITIEDNTNVEASFAIRPPFDWNLFFPAIIQGHH